MASGTVTIRANTLLFQAWLRLLLAMAAVRLLSKQRAWNLALRGSRLILIKVDGHRWRRLNPVEWHDG